MTIIAPVMTCNGNRMYGVSGIKPIQYTTIAIPSANKIEGVMSLICAQML